MKACYFTEEWCSHGSISTTEISLSGKSFGVFRALHRSGGCSVVLLLELRRASGSQDDPGSPLTAREGERDHFTGDCSEPFPADGNLAGKGPGQLVLEVKLALFGAGGWISVPSNLRFSLILSLWKNRFLEEVSFNSLLHLKMQTNVNTDLIFVSGFGTLH